MWQFMPYGDYGLARNEYVDERFDPEKSTRAYARYMKFLYDQLGDYVPWAALAVVVAAALVMFANSRGLPGRRAGAGGGHEAQYVGQSVPR